MLHSIWDLSTPTRNQSHTPALDCQRRPLEGLKTGGVLPESPTQCFGTQAAHQNQLGNIGSTPALSQINQKKKKSESLGIWALVIFQSSRMHEVWGSMGTIQPLRATEEETAVRRGQTS